MEQSRNNIDGHISINKQELAILQDNIISHIASGIGASYTKTKKILDGIAKDYENYIKYELVNISKEEKSVDMKHNINEYVYMNNPAVTKLADRILSALVPLNTIKICDEKIHAVLDNMVEEYSDRN